MNRDDFETAVFALLDTEISPVALSELQGHLRGSAEARLEYRELVAMHGLMLDRRAGEGAVRFDNVIPMDRLVARQKRRSLRMAMLAGGIAVAACLVFAVFVASPDAPAARIKGSLLAEFSVTHSAAEGGEAPAGDVLEVGSRLQLQRGSIELAFRSGTVAIVHAPADLILHRPDLVGFHFGSGRFTVPGKAAGFQVETPELRLTDLGTEFGVVSEVEAPDEVHVFEGRVEVERLRGPPALESLAAGSARASVPGGGWRMIDPDPTRFSTGLLPGIDVETFDVDVADTAAFNRAYPRMSTAERGGVGRISVSGGRGFIMHPDVRNAFHVSAMRPGFTGEVIYSVEIGASACNGKFNLGMRIGDTVVAFHPGEEGGRLRIERQGGYMPAGGMGDRHKLWVWNRDMGFTPAHDVLHHLEVTQYPNGLFRVKFTDGSDPTKTFRASWEDPGLVGQPFGVYRDGSWPEGVVFFDNLKMTVP